MKHPFLMEVVYNQFKKAISNEIIQYLMDHKGDEKAIALIIKWRDSK